MGEGDEAREGKARENEICVCVWEERVGGARRKKLRGRGIGRRAIGRRDIRR